MKGRTLAIVVAVLAAGAVLFFWPKKAKSPEDEVRALFAQCVQAAEDRKLDVISDAIDDGFKARGAGKDEVKQLLAYQLLRDRETVSILNPSLEVTLVSPEKATLSSELIFARQKAKSGETLAPEQVLAAYHLDATVEKKGGQWKFVTADYRSH